MSYEQNAGKITKLRCHESSEHVGKFKYYIKKKKHRERERERN